MLVLLASLLLSPVQTMAPGLKTRTPILTYHDIIEKRGKDALWFDCTIGEFRSQLDWLTRQGAKFISLKQLYDHLAKGQMLPARAVLITFADNYLGFYKFALPELRTRRIPSVMFVHTGFVGSSVGRPKMNWTQLAELAKAGLVEIQSQTVSHPEDLRTLDAKHLEKEMAQSKLSLEKWTGKKCWAVAYPNGKFDSRAIRAAQKAGYLIGFSEELRPAEKAPDIFSVPRYVHTQYRKAWTDCYKSKREH